jgi:hypothetical protein
MSAHEFRVRSTTREEHLMTMKQPRFSGPDPIVREAAKRDRACTIAIQALCRGAFDWRVQGVTGAAARRAKPI